ncbi:MAG: phosphotransacetylase family protein [Candidatus Methanomethylophilaceae archaeon]|nr:phosphotransacetylase family protein [Candidatus Methanomethylophilaceae archaeon]
MKKVYLASIGQRSGKSVLSLGIARNFPGKVGFYKPFRESMVKWNGTAVDQDAMLMSYVLGWEDKLSLSPFSYDIFDPVGMDDILDAYERLKEGRDLMIIEGSRDLTNGFTHGLSHLDLAKALDAPMVLVSSNSPTSIDGTFMFKSICDQRGLDVRGVVLNKCQGCQERELLESRGIPVLGEIPPIPELRSFRVSEIIEKTSASVLAGEKGLDRMVEDVLVGAMSPQTAIRYMRRGQKKAVITGGDRTEIQLAALSTDTSCIVLTGGITPPRTILARAEEINVPILLLDGDTLAVSEVIEHLIARVDPRDQEKMDIITRRVRAGVDLERLWE